jgi:SAM-dependent methyltransferase
MAHKEQLDFFSTILESGILKGKQLRILEIGSLDINGTTRQLCGHLSISEYIGLDLGAGPGVDVIRSGHEYLSDSHDQFDLILSAECLEHNPFWRETIENSIRLLKPQGLLIFSWATTGRAEHGTHANSPESAPFIVQDFDNYYRNISRRDLKKIKLRDNFTYEAIMQNFSHKDLYWVATKCSSAQITLVRSSVISFSKLLSINNEKWNRDYEKLLAKKMRKKLDKYLNKRISKRFDENLRKLRIRIKEHRLRPRIVVYLSRIYREQFLLKSEFIEIRRGS